MKSILIIFCTLLVVPYAPAHTPWKEGQVLNVFASSGLKLRAFPNRSAEVLDLVRFGDQVTVLNSFDFANDKADRIDWIDGHWIFVEFDGIAGYLFDGYLSDLVFPGTEEEICNDGYSYAYTLAEYIELNYALQEILDTSTQHQSKLFEKGIKLRKWNGDNYQKIEIELPGIKINEILNLLRTMVPNKVAKSQFEKSLIFVEDIQGNIQKIKINVGDPVTLQVKENGNLLVRASGLAGC